MAAQKKGIWLQLLLAAPLFLMSSFSSQAAVTVVSSNDFSYTFTPDKPATKGFSIRTIGFSSIKIGEFSFDSFLPIVSDLYDPVSNPTGLRPIELSITFPVYDGDTAPGTIDWEDIVLSLGDQQGNLVTTFMDLYLAGYENEAYNINTNKLTLPENSWQAIQVMDLLKFTKSNSIISFYITDLDEGGNRFYFSESDTGLFRLDITFDRAAPIPLPATIFLFGGSLAGMGVLRRTMRKGK